MVLYITIPYIRPWKKPNYLGSWLTSSLRGPESLCVELNSEASRRCKCVVAAGTVPCSSTRRSQAGTKGIQGIQGGAPQLFQTSFRWFLDFRNHSSLPRWSPLSRWTPSDVGWFITPMEKYRYIYHKPKWNWSYVHLVSVHELWHHLVPDRDQSMAGQAHHRSDGDSHPKITQRTSTAPLGEFRDLIETQKNMDMRKPASECACHSVSFAFHCVGSFWTATLMESYPIKVLVLSVLWTTYDYIPTVILLGGCCLSGILFLCVQTWEHYLDMISLDQIILDQYRSVGEIDRPLVSDLFL